MRRFVVLAALLAVPGGTALASPMTVEGFVVSAQSRWTSDGSRIVTEAVVRTPDGSEIVVSQLGGTVDGLTMRTFPGPEIMVPGMQVAVAAHADSDLSMRMHNVVDSMRVMAFPPGYVRTGPTKAGKYLFWESGCVYVTVDADGTKEIPGDQEFAIVDAAIAAWNDGTRSCSYLDIVQDKRAKMEVGKDKINVIKFRDTSWCRPKVGDDAARCYSPAAAGLTTAVYVDDENSPRDGAIVDADIELNGVDFSIAGASGTLGTATCQADLQNTLTHELGHLLGFEHPCRAGGDPPRLDSMGRNVPMCGATADPSILEATMYNFQDCGETKKQTLTDDEIQAMCQTYPKADDPGTCDRVLNDDGLCNASGGGSPIMFLLGMAGLVFVTTRRRR